MSPWTSSGWTSIRPKRSLRTSSDDVQDFLDRWSAVGAYSKATVDALKGYTFDRKALGARSLGYEKLDQLTIEVLLGVR